MPLHDGNLLSRIIDRHPYTKSLCFFGIYYFPVLTDVLAEYELAQFTVNEFRRVH